MVLHHIGRDAAGIGNGVMDSVGGLDMLPHIVHTHIHQLHRVQGAAAQMGTGGGVGADALEPEVSLTVGHHAAGHHRVAAGGMPGDGQIQTVKHTGAGHIGLAAAPLLGGGADEHHGAAFSGLLQIVPDFQSRAHRGGSQQMVPAAVAVVGAGPGTGGGETGLLGHTAEGVVLRQQAYHRTAAAVGGGEGGVHIRKTGGDREALSAHQLGDGRGAFVFLEPDLGVIPDPVAEFTQQSVVVAHHLLPLNSLPKSTRLETAVKITPTTVSAKATREAVSAPWVMGSTSMVFSRAK